MTLNLHDGLNETGQNNLYQTLQLLEAEKPDVVSIQEIEYKQLNIFRDAGYQVLTGMNYNLFPYHFGNAILTRHKIIYHRHHFLPSNKEQRGLDEAAIDVKGNPFIVLNTHLGLGHAEQQQQFAEIRRIISYLHTPLILSGDFNVPVQSTLFNDFKMNFNEIGQTIPISNSFPASKPQERLDQIWYSRDWQPREAQTLLWDGSDHLPVTAELELVTPSPVPVVEEKIPEMAPDNNPLLPNVGWPPPSISVIYKPEAKGNKISGGIIWPLAGGVRFSGEYDGDSGFSPGLYYHLATFDLRDYLSKWRIRGKAEWATSVTAGPDDEPWLTWDQYYRWSDHQGTKIKISNRNYQMNYNVQQISLFAKQIGWTAGWDSQNKLSLGICFTPDRRNAIEIRWYPDNPDQKWQVRWNYQ